MTSSIVGTYESGKHNYLQFVNIAWVMKTYYVFELFVAFFSIEFSKALECQNQNNVDYCMIKGYNRDQFPPYPPLNVSFNFDVKVRIFNTGIPWFLWFQFPQFFI